MEQRICQDREGRRFGAVRMVNRLAFAVLCAAIMFNFPGRSGGGGVFDCNGETVPPTPIVLTPNVGLQGTTVEVEIFGTSLQPNATISITGTGISVSNIRFTDTQRLRATFTIAANAPVGQRNVGVSGTLGGFFTVQAANTPPSLGITPATGPNGSVVNVTLTGVNFTPGTTIALNGTGITVSNVQIVSATQITATFTIAGNASVNQGVTVTTPNGTSNAVEFRVDNSIRPILSSVSPAQGTVGSTVNVTLEGTNFAPSAIVAVSGTGVTVSNVQFVSATRITATFTIAANAADTVRNVTVTVGNQTSNDRSFSVRLPPPTLTTITPNSGRRDTFVDVTLTGTNLGNLILVSGGGITVSNARRVSATQATARFTIAATAGLGPHNVTVGNSGGTSNPVTFTVNPATNNAAPTLTNIAPTELRQGNARQVVLTGTNFTPGTTVNITGTGVAISNVRVDSTTQITAQFTVSPSAATGRRSVTVTTANGSASRNFLILQFICDTC